LPILNGEDNLATKLDLYSTVYVSSIVVGELYFGAYGSTNKIKNLERIKKFLPRCSVLLPDESTADIYGQIKTALRKKGRPIPDNDIWIAALATQHKIILATRDAHFNEVSNLKTVRW
jgi:tRNA(fMet)-specific endonuclease VapC